MKRSWRDLAKAGGHSHECPICGYWWPCPVPGRKTRGCREIADRPKISGRVYDRKAGGFREREIADRRCPKHRDYA